MFDCKANLLRHQDKQQKKKKNLCEVPKERKQVNAIH